MEYPTFQAWKNECVRYSKEEGLTVDDMWDKDDPYDLVEVAQESYENGDTPADFINEIFGEDLARLEHDGHQYNESIQHNNFDDDADEDDVDFDGQEDDGDFDDD